MHNVTKVSTFLKQLQLLISSFINSSHVIENYEYDAVDDQVVEILAELRNLLQIPSVREKFIQLLLKKILM